MPVNIEQWHASIGLFQPILGLPAVGGFRDLRVVNYKVIVFLFCYCFPMVTLKSNLDQREHFQSCHVVIGM